MTAAVQNKKRRPFTMIDNDCYDKRIFDNVYQKLVYEALVRFADANNQCFPSLERLAFACICCKRKVQDALKELKEKCFIDIQSRFKEDGSRTSNLYTLFELPWLKDTDSENEAVPVMPGEDSALKSTPETISDDIAVPENEPVEESKIVETENKAEVMPEDITVQEKESVSDNAMSKKENSTIGKKLMSRLKNIAGKEKEPTSAPSKVSDVSHINNHLTGNNNTTPVAESQPLERYSLDWIKNYFEYDIMLHDNPSCQKDVDSVMSILYDTLNTTRPTIRINGDDKPSMVVIGKLMKLTMLDIKYAIDKFNEQTDKINNPKAYMLTILYNAQEQQHLDVSNQVKHDMYNATKPAEEQPKKNTYQKSKNQFFEFHQRDVTKEEMDELERKLLGLH